MKNKIINKWGDNTGKDIRFPEVTLSDGTKSCSFYTYKGNVYILDNTGMDNPFDEYPIEDQKKLLKSIDKNF